jgi:hypothetical protein
MVRFPKMQLKDPFAKAGLAPWKKWAIALAALVVVAGGLWMFNLLSWAGLQSPLPRYNQVEAVEEVVECADSLATADTVIVDAVPAE